METMNQNTCHTQPSSPSLQELERLTCSDAVLKLLELRLKALSKEATEDLVSLIPEFNACKTIEEQNQLSQTVRELIFPELIGGMTDAAPSPGVSDKLQRRMEWIGQRVRDRRKELNLSQIDVANTAGLPQSHISRIEAGKISPSHRTLEKLAIALQIKVGDLDPSYN